VIAIDTNIWISAFGPVVSPHRETVFDLLLQGRAGLIPMVVSEVLTGDAPAELRACLTETPFLEIYEGYWERTGLLRRRFLQAGFRPKLIDTLIAQMCLDHRIPLLTADKGFEHFAQHAGLRLA
jgi:predicted nucleic acid-binding protein